MPLIEPLYSTYHTQTPGTAIIVENKTIRNWYLNQTMELTCSRKFLHGFTSPEINIVDSSWYSNTYIDKRWISTEFTKGYINPIIREFIDKGYYVYFSKVDDYYIKGKSWYKEHHFSHDGLICGYDQNEKTYCIYAYDSNWVCRKFWTPQKSFNAGMIAMRKKGIYSVMCGLKANSDVIDFSPKIALKNIKYHLDSNIEKYPFDGEEKPKGLVVHQYISEYVTKLYNGDIPYERMDRRVFRLIWEHKKAMLERIVNIEKFLNLTNENSEKYKFLVSEANTMRMLYASHHMKRRDSVLPIIKNKLLNLMDKEKELLSLLVVKAEKELENETLDILKE